MEEESGFFDLPESLRICQAPGPEPPMHMYVPPGKGYRHVCPTCGKVTILVSSKGALIKSEPLISTIPGTTEELRKLLGV